MTSDPTKPSAKKWYVETRAALGVGAWVLAIGAEALIGAGAAAIACVVVGGILFLLAAASSKPVQRQIPAIGRAPLVHDHGFRTVAPDEAPPGPEPAPAAKPSQPAPAPPNPYAQARKLQDDFQRKQLPVAVAQISEELEHGQHVLASGDAPEFFVRHELATDKWRKHGEKLVELPHLHKRVRTAYIAIDALNNRGVRRDGVLSGGQPTTMIDGDRRREARELIAAAIGALEEHASTGKDVSAPLVITPDVRAALLRIAANGRSVYGQADSMMGRSLAESIVGDWTDEAADALHDISAELAEGFLRAAKGNGPDAILARIKYLEDRADGVESEPTGA